MAAYRRVTVGTVLLRLVVGALGLGVLWLVLLLTNSPIVPLVLGQSTAIDSGEVDGDIVPSAEPAALGGQWSCYYEPTINDDWHDDVFCTNGVDSQRPILLEGQFVTQADMEAAAVEYAAQLNGG